MLLQEAPIEDLKVESSKSSSPWKPQLHYAWTTIFQAYFPPDGNPSPSHSSFQEFYRAAVEGQFLLMLARVVMKLAALQNLYFRILHRRSGNRGASRWFSWL